MEYQPVLIDFCPATLLTDHGYALDIRAERFRAVAQVEPGRTIYDAAIDFLEVPKKQQCAGPQVPAPFRDVLRCRRVPSTTRRDEFCLARSTQQASSRFWKDGIQRVREHV